MGPPAPPDASSRLEPTGTLSSLGQDLGHGQLVKLLLKLGGCQVELQVFFVPVLAHGASFYPTARVRAATVEEMFDADAVIVAAGKGGGPDDSRLDLLRVNAAIVGEIAALGRSPRTATIYSNRRRRTCLRFGSSV